MSLRELLRSEKEVCLGLARYYAPMDTGNLRYNAIKAYNTSDGFSIDYDLSSAFYTYFLEEGTRYSTRHQGFIANLTYPAIASYVNAKYADYSEDLIDYYKENSAYGNYDIYSVHTTQFDSSGQQRTRQADTFQNYQLDRREQRQLSSKLANMETYGHMSNEFSWGHNADFEREQPDLKKKF